MEGVLSGGVLPGPGIVYLVTYGNEEPNIMTVSYASQLSSRMVCIGLRPSRYSNKVINITREFGLSFPTTALIREVDYCGSVSGRNENKFEKTGLTPVKPRVISTPLIEECPLGFECDVVDIRRYGTHDWFVGLVKNIRDDRGDEDPDWLLHVGLDYLGRDGKVGEVYKEGSF